MFLAEVRSTVTAENMSNTWLKLQVRLAQREVHLHTKDCSILANYLEGHNKVTL